MLFFALECYRRFVFEHSASGVAVESISRNDVVIPCNYNPMKAKIHIQKVVSVIDQIAIKIKALSSISATESRFLPV